MITDGGGWTKVLEKEYNSIQKLEEDINDLNLNYTELYVDATNFSFDYLNNTINNWNVEGFDFGKIGIKLDNYEYYLNGTEIYNQRGCGGNYNSPYEVQVGNPNYFNLEEYIIFKTSSKVYYGNINYPNLGAKSFKINIEDMKFKGFLDIESLGGCNTNNQFDGILKVYLR